MGVQLKPYQTLSVQERERRNDRVMNHIKYTLASVNSALLFAESKNGALLAMNIALIRAFKSTGEINRGTIVLTAMLLFSVVMAGLSFYPRVLRNRNTESVTAENCNLMFFQSLAGLETSDYVRQLYAIEHVDVRPSETDLPPPSLWLADEIIVKSYITTVKHKYFKIALAVTVAACLAKLTMIVLTFNI